MSWPWQGESTEEIIRILKIGLVTANKDMTIDRPFFFGIDDRPTATWLFLGHVTDPQT